MQKEQDKQHRHNTT